MNYKSKKQISVNDIYCNDNGYECQAVIKNFSNLRKWISVGENIESNEFCLIFGDSIGESKWKLLFYPNGQYVDEQAGHHVGIYLQLLSCEKEDSTLTSSVTFRFIPVKKCEHEGYVTHLNKEFSYSTPVKRWIGKPDFVGKRWFNSKQFKRQFLANDTLIISCFINELYANDVKLNETLRETISTNSQVSTNDQSRTVCVEEKPRDGKNNDETGWTLVDHKKGKGYLENKDSNNGAPKQKSSVYINMLSICVLLIDIILDNRQKRNNKQGGKKKK